ncbi:hypothetical protein [Streptomyces sp. DB-54]
MARPAQRAPRPEREHEAKPTPKPKPAPKPARAPLPAPRRPSQDGTRLAHRILAELRRDDPRLLLSEADVARLAPAVHAWLEREAPPDAVRRTLAANLPSGLRQPAAFLAHRLTASLPPPLPAAAPAPARPDPLQTCDGCERAFRAPQPGWCRDCRPDLTEAA